MKSTTGGPTRRSACHAFLLLLFFLALGAVPPALAQEDKLDSYLHLLLDATSTADLDELGQSFQLETDTDYAYVGVMIRAVPGTSPAFLESACACGLQTESAAPGPPLVPGGPPSFDLIPASVPFVMLGNPSDNRHPGQPLMILASLPEVVHISASGLVEPSNDIGTNNTGIADAAGAPVFLGANAQILHQTGVDGTNVVVGIVDTGIDWRHRDFRDPVTGCTRILSLWDQTDVAGRCTAPAPRRNCTPGIPGDALCAAQPVCSGTAAVVPCSQSIFGTLLCKLKTLNIASVCAPAVGATCNPVSGGRVPGDFNFGTEWEQADIDFGLGCGGPGPTGVAPAEVDIEGHGSHVAGTAAGNGSASGGGAPFRFEGMAPRSGIIAVKTNFDSRAVAAGVRYVFARANGTPAVINLSLGNQGGPHDGTSNFDRDVSQTTGPGRLVVVAAGNERNKAIHAENRGNAVAANATQTTTFRVNAAGQGTVELAFWHHNGDRYTVTVTGPGGMPVLVNVPPGPPVAVSPAAPNGTRITVANAILGAAAQADLGAREIYIRLTAPLGPPPPGANGVTPGNWTVRLTRNAGGTGDGIWDAWIVSGDAGFVTGAAGDGRPTNARKLREPGTADGVITVASHNTKNGGRACSVAPFGNCTTDAFCRLVTGNMTATCNAVLEQPLGDINFSSSPGPTRTGKMKPELSAPGFRIASALSARAGTCAPPGGTAGRPCDPTAAPGSMSNPCPGPVGAAGGCVARIADADATHFLNQGTSMAAPHVTGCLALMLQQDPTLTPATALKQLLALIRTDSRSVMAQNQETGVLAVAGHWNADFGWGKLNCALKAKNVIGAGGAYFSVDRGAVGIAGDILTNNHPAHVYIGDRSTNGLGVDKALLGLGTADNPGMGILDNVDAFSFQIDPRILVPSPRISGIEFSVHPASIGLPGTAVNNHPAHRQGHIWLAPWPFPFFGFFAGVNVDLYSELDLGLSFGDNLDATDLENPLLPVVRRRDGTTAFPANAAFPLSRPQSVCSGAGCCRVPMGGGPTTCDGDVQRPCTRDDDCRGVGVPMFFSLDPASPTLGLVNGRPADILVALGDGQLPRISIPAAALGLVGGAAGCVPPACDDVDAFFIDHLGNTVFSLRPGSPSLAAIGARPADLLQPNGARPALFLPAAALGLDRVQDDLDALDVEGCRFTARRRFVVKDLSEVDTGAYVEVANPRGVLRIGKGVMASDGTRFVADHIHVGASSHVANLSGNTIAKGRGVTVSGVEFPAPPLPLALDLSPRTPTTCSGPPVTVAAKGSLTLPPGAYGALSVGDQGTLTLEEGPYSFCSVRTQQQVHIALTGDQPATLEIAGNFQLGAGNVFEPMGGTPLPVVEVGGTQVQLNGAEIVANIRAPASTVRLGRSASLRGSLLADIVNSDHSCRLGCANQTPP